MKFRKHGRLVFVALLGVFVAMGSECPQDPNGNNNNDNQNNNNSGDPTQNVLGLTSALLSANRKNVIGDTQSRFMAVGNPSDISGVNTTELAVDIARPGVIVGIGVNSSGHVLLLYSDKIEVFATEESITDNTPSRTVQLSSRMDVAYTMAFDQDHASLYVVGNSDGIEGHVIVYDNTDSADFDGDPEPVRSITAPILTTVKALQYVYVSHDDKLYLEAITITGQAGGESAIIAFDHASTLGADGDPAAHDRIIEFPEFEQNLGDIGQFAVDANDNLLVYAALQTGTGADLKIVHGIISVPNAASLNGEVLDPDFISFEPFTVLLSGGMVIDSTSNSYFSYYTNIDGTPAIGVYESVVGRSGDVPPDRTFDVQDLDASETLSSEVMYLVD